MGRSDCSNIQRQRDRVPDVGVFTPGTNGHDRARHRSQFSCGTMDGALELFKGSGIVGVRGKVLVAKRRCHGDGGDL